LQIVCWQYLGYRKAGNNTFVFSENSTSAVELLIALKVKNTFTLLTPKTDNYYRPINFNKVISYQTLFLFVVKQNRVLLILLT